MGRAVSSEGFGRKTTLSHISEKERKRPYHHTHGAKDQPTEIPLGHSRIFHSFQVTKGCEELSEMLFTP